MSRRDAYDAIVVGSGPNGLAAAITLAQTGRSVVVFEARDTIGGGSRSMELTLPGFIHDVCSAIHPLGPSPRRWSGRPPRAFSGGDGCGTWARCGGISKAHGTTRCRLGYPRRRLPRPTPTAIDVSSLRARPFRLEGHSFAPRTCAKRVSGSACSCAFRRLECALYAASSSVARRGIWSDPGHPWTYRWVANAAWRLAEVR